MEFPDYQCFDAQIKTNVFSIELSSPNRMILIEYLMAEIKRVVIENYELDHHVKSMLINVFWIFLIISFRRMVGTKCLQIDSSSTSIEFSIDTLMEEIRLLVMEKEKLDYRDESLKVTLFLTVFGLSRLCCKEEKSIYI